MVGYAIAVNIPAVVGLEAGEDAVAVVVPIQGVDEAVAVAVTAAFLAVPEPVVIAVEIVRIGAQLRFLVVAQAVAIAVLGRDLDIVVVEEVGDPVVVGIPGALVGIHRPVALGVVVQGVGDAVAIEVVGALLAVRDAVTVAVG